MVDSNGKVLFWDEIKRKTKMEEEEMASVKTPIEKRAMSSVAVGDLIDQMFGSVEEREAEIKTHGTLPEGSYALENTGDDLGAMLCVTDEQAEADLQVIRSFSN